MRRSAMGLAGVALFSALLVACGDGREPEASASLEALEIADQEDPVCGMIVRDQPAPRGQVVHRDGTRFFFCSVADMLAHLEAPSPHGSVSQVFVEVQPSGAAPAQRETSAHPWVQAQEASFVVGVERPGIMGEPVMSFAQRPDAEAAAAAHGGRVVDFAELAASLRDEGASGDEGHAHH